MDRPRILVDSREQAPLKFSNAVDVERVTLVTGDYSIAGATDYVALERKSLPDLVSCAGPERSRFLDCCKRLTAYPLRAIVVEATLDELLMGMDRSRVRPSCVVGTCVALHADLGIPTIWAGRAEVAAQIVERLLVRVWRKRVLSGVVAA